MDPTLVYQIQENETQGWLADLHLVQLKAGWELEKSGIERVLVNFPSQSHTS